MRLAVPFVLAMVVACAPTQNPGSPMPEAQTVRVSGGGGSGGSISLRSSGPDQRADTIWTPLPQVWTHMPAVYTALEIPISDVDPKVYAIGTTGFKAYRRLGKTTLSKLLDCGRTQVGQNADSYDIHLSVMSTLQSVGENNMGTAVVTTVQAMAKPIQFPGEYFPCRSKGELERQMALSLKVRAAP